MQELTKLKDAYKTMYLKANLDILGAKDIYGRLDAGDKKAWKNIDSKINKMKKIIEFKEALDLTYQDMKRLSK